VPAQYASAWRLETARLRRRGLKVLHPRNRMLWYLAVPLAMAGGLAAALGWGAMLFYLAHGLVAAFLLEIINYLEHYGLVRRVVGTAEDGGERYEKLGPQHSWNTNSRLTNWGLFNLGRHSDHHMAVELPYQALGNSAGTPQLPAGYAAMFMAALVPPVWRRVMDRRALEWRQAPSPAAGAAGMAEA
jgi:alkane 1-monooxygenase